MTAVPRLAVQSSPTVIVFTVFTRYFRCDYPEYFPFVLLRSSNNGVDLPYVTVSPLRNFFFYSLSLFDEGRNKLSIVIKVIACTMVFSFVSLDCVM